MPKVVYNQAMPSDTRWLKRMSKMTTEHTTTKVNFTIRGVTKEIEIIQQEETNVWYRTTDYTCGVYKKHGANKQWLSYITYITFIREVDGSFRALTTETFMNKSGYKLVSFNDGDCQNLSLHNSAL